MKSSVSHAIHHNPKDEVSSCRFSMTSYGDLQTMNRNAMLTPRLCLFAKRFPPRRWSFPGRGSENKWYSTHKRSPHGQWVAVSMMIKFGESGHPVLRVTSPFSQPTLQSKRDGNLSLRFCTDGNVPTEHSQICVMNSWLVKQERVDPCLQDNLTH